jgi:HK97 family phage portal protein
MKNYFKILARKVTKAANPLGSRLFLRRAAGVYVDETTAMQVSAYYRGVIYVATQIAKLPWDIKDENNKKQKTDRLHKILNTNPNPEMSAFTFRLLMIMTAINKGNAYAEIERDRVGRVIRLWPINTDAISIVRSSTGELVYRVAAGSMDRPGENVYLKPRDIFHLKNFHTKDGLLGLGLVEYAAETIGISHSADKMAGNLFANGGLPSGIIKLEGKLSDEAFLRLTESWKEAHGGRKTGGTAILEDGASFEPVDMDPKLLQFLESRQFGVVEIARFLGVPPTKLFDMAHSTFSNVENANLEVATDTLDAWARNLESEADMKLLTDNFGGKYTQLDLYAVFRGDMTTRSNYFSKMMQSGSITPNEIREKEGMAGYDDGDRYYIAVNNFTPADRVDEVIDSQVKTNEKTNDNSEDNNDPVTEAIVDFLKK